MEGAGPETKGSAGAGGEEGWEQGGGGRERWGERWGGERQMGEGWGRKPKALLEQEVRTEGSWGDGWGRGGEREREVGGGLESWGVCSWRWGVGGMGG